MTLRIFAFLFASCLVLAEDSITVYLDSSSGSLKIQSFLSGQLAPDKVDFKFITLPDSLNLISQAEVEIVSRAMAQEVTVLPCIVFVSPKDVVTARIVGSPKLNSQQERESFLKLIEKHYQESKTANPPKQSPTNAETNAELLVLMHELRVNGVTPHNLQTMRKLWSDEGISVDNKQILGLKLLSPALLTQYQGLYKNMGDHSPETESLFLEAISIIEGVRDEKPDSILGKQAHELRESLRKARLKAADFDS